jgi:hypothetical protein
MRWYPKTKLELDTPEYYSTLRPDFQEALDNWISNNIKPAKTWWNRSSYGLKHDFERDTEIYVTNGQFKGAMLKAGYEPEFYDELNWGFKARFINRRR